MTHIARRIVLVAFAAAALLRPALAEPPKFEVDPSWPKPFPGAVQLGTTIGVAVDAQDHVWIVHRTGQQDGVEAAGTNKTGLCCTEAKPIIEFDQAGTMLRSWGGADGPGG